MTSLVESKSLLLVPTPSAPAPSSSASCYTWRTDPTVIPSKANSSHFSSQNVSAKQHCPFTPSVCEMCVCVCVCVCVRASLRLNPCLHYVLAFFFLFFFSNYFIAANISISMYIMCVILCLFSALIRRVGALQISIIVIITQA